MVNKRAPGYTLVEAMLVVAIIGILASIGSSLLIHIQKFFILSRARIELQSQARSAMYVITRELHEAQSNTIVVDRSGPTQPFFSRITFTKIADSNGHQYQIVFDQVNGDELWISKQCVVGCVGNAQTQRLSKDVAYLAFTFPNSADPTLVSVSFTLQRLIYQGQLKALHMASQQVQVMN